MENKKLLVVVDMQRDFVEGVLGSEEAKAIVGKVKDKMAVSDFTVCTFDTHEENYMETQEGKNLPVKHCIRGTEGHQIVPELAEYLPKCFTVEKNTFGSVQLGLFVVDYFDRGVIDSVELVGVCTDICVISNAMLIKAFCPEITVTVDAACCAGVTTNSHMTALKAMQACQIRIDNMTEAAE